MKKKKIIHFIFNLGRGGAETIVVAEIKGLPEYEHVVVTLFNTNHFGNELKCDKLICLNFTSLFSIFKGIFNFKKILKTEQPDLVHTHLFWPTIIARIATPKKIPLVTTIHAFIATSVEYKKWFVKFLDKVTYQFRKTVIVADAQGALDEYFSFLKLTPYKAQCLYTFADTNKFKNLYNQVDNTDKKVFKIVSVGALREQKNQQFLIKVLSKIKDLPVELHIYGSGELEKTLQHKIDTTGAKVLLKGEVNNIQEVIASYDLFIMSSTYEGFSLAVLEAMAMGMPLLLSDIASFKEQGADTATYFSLADETDLIQKIKIICTTSKASLQSMGENCRKRVLQYFTLDHHIDTLRKIYSENLIS
jgi:glycosyltransferase involved in cell wall biosynthesis